MSTQKKIFIVEDNELNLKLFRDILEAHEYIVVDTKDGTLAVGIAETEMPDLIVMDIQLPNISGTDIIRAIKQHDKLKHIPIIAVTAFAMREDREKIMAEGCESYLAKPISIKPFIETIQYHIAEKNT